MMMLNDGMFNKCIDRLAQWEFVTWKLYCVF